MPFEQKYTSETREASLARILERRDNEPGNRAIIREVAEEFQVGEQSLRGWIRAHEKTTAPAAPAEKKREAAVAEPAAAETSAPTSAPAPARRPVGRPSASAVASTGASTSSDGRVAELEAEVAKLRSDREALKSALAVLLSE